MISTFQALFFSIIDHTVCSFIFEVCDNKYISVHFVLYFINIRLDLFLNIDNGKNFFINFVISECR